MKKLHTFSLGLFVVVLLSLTGCEALLLNAAMDFNLSLEPAQITVSRGSSTEVTIKVKRVLPVNVTPVPISLTLYNPPAGVSLEDEQVDIPSGIDERVLTILVDSSATLGDHELTIEGTTGLKTKQATLNVAVE